MVTGSYIRRTDTESPSPVDVISADDILKRGMTTMADVMHYLVVGQQRHIDPNFSGAMAGGASGVSLRGLTVDATLVLVDGHRMATYPLADDGQRPFVDIGSLPLGIVDRVEVLKDGASAIYGSDAIAGVVNIITKKEFTGFDASTELGLFVQGRWPGAATVGDLRVRQLSEPTGTISISMSNTGTRRKSNRKIAAPI